MLFAALVAGYFAWKSAQASHMQAQAANKSLEPTRRDRQREQAKLVAVWPSFPLRYTPDGDRAVIVLANQSSLPVYGVHLTSRAYFAEVKDEVKQESTIEVLPPGEQQLAILFPPPDTALPGAAPRITVALRFIDSQGLVWIRDGSGFLRAAGQRSFEVRTMEDLKAKGIDPMHYED